MPVKLDIWSDYNCPWCFMASQSVAMLEASHGVEVEWHSYELRPKGSPPIPESYMKRIEETRPRLAAMAQEQFGITLKPGRFGIDSRPALIGAKFAETQGKGNEYHKAVMSAYWEQGRDIEDIVVLEDIAVSLGLEGADFLASLKDRSYEALVDTDILTAQQMELSGVPALLFEHKYLIPGAQPYDELVNALEYVKKCENITA